MMAKSKLLKFVPLFALLAGVSSCSMLDQRDFHDQMDNRFALDEPMFRPYDDFPVVPGDQGRFMGEREILGRVPATERMSADFRHQNSITNELVQLENRLNDVEFEQYSMIKAELGSHYERIYYLRLHPSERRAYLSARGIETKKIYTAQEAMRMPASTGIGLGMDKTEVIGFWGEPDRRDYSGHPADGNERWAYSRNGRVKYIYFEGGYVEGWSEQ